MMMQFVQHDGHPAAVRGSAVHVDGALTAEERKQPMIVCSVGVHHAQLHQHIGQVLPGVQFALGKGKVPKGRGAVLDGGVLGCVLGCGNRYGCRKAVQEYHPGH